MSTRSLPSLLRPFIPTKEVTVTPIILSANVLVWLIMIMSGVDFLTPSTKDLHDWGSTNATSVVNGDYWRLFTSNYLHFGIVHLAVNMFSFNNLGRMLEQFIGKWRFALIYTFSGIAASAVSIWWNPLANGVGASGAILGVVGILLALLTTNLIERNARMKMLRSMAISAGLMIAISFAANVDNAAHIGGLLAGMIGGYFIFPELRAHYYEKKKQYLGLVAALLVISGATAWFVTHAGGINTQEIQQMTAEFEYEEALAQEKFRQGKFRTAQEVNDSVVEIYRIGVFMMDIINESVANPQSAAYYQKKTRYIEARKRYYEWVCIDMEAGKSTSDSTVYWLRTSDSLFGVMNSQ